VRSTGPRTIWGRGRDATRARTDSKSKPDAEYTGRPNEEGAFKPALDVSDNRSRAENGMLCGKPLAPGVLTACATDCSEYSVRIPSEDEFDEEAWLLSK
jgi:hypothetical protein